MEEVRDDDVDPAVIAGVRAELARLGYTDVPDDVIMAHVKGNIAKERARIAALAAAATPPLPPVPPPPAPSQLLTAAPPAEADAEATPAVGAASTTATPREAQASDPASAAPPPAPTGVASPRVNDNPFHRSEAEAKAAANKRRPPSASRKPPPVPTLAAPAAATVSPSEREIAAAQAQLEGEIRSDDPDEQLRDAIRAELAKMGITNVPAAMLEDEVKRIKKEQGGKPKTPEQASVDTVLREAVKVELQAMGLADVPEDLIDEEVARIKTEAGTDVRPSREGRLWEATAPVVGHANPDGGALLWSPQPEPNQSIIDFLAGPQKPSATTIEGRRDPPQAVTLLRWDPGKLGKLLAFAAMLQVLANDGLALLVHFRYYADDKRLWMVTWWTMFVSLTLGLYGVYTAFARRSLQVATYVVLSMMMGTCSVALQLLTHFSLKTSCYKTQVSFHGCAPCACAATDSCSRGDLDLNDGCGACHAWPVEVCDRFRQLDTLVVLAAALLHLLAFAVPATLGLLLLVRKEFSDGSYRARNIWMKLQLQDQIGLLEQGVMPTMKGEALMKLADVCAVHYPDMAIKCKNLYTELCNEVYDHALVNGYYDPTTASQSRMSAKRESAQGSVPGKGKGKAASAVAAPRAGRVRPSPTPLEASLEVPWPDHMKHLQDDDPMAPNIPGSTQASSPRSSVQGGRLDKPPLMESAQVAQRAVADRYGDVGPSRPIGGRNLDVRSSAQVHLDLGAAVAADTEVGAIGDEPATEQEAPPWTQRPRSHRSDVVDEADEALKNIEPRSRGSSASRVRREKSPSVAPSEQAASERSNGSERREKEKGRREGKGKETDEQRKERKERQKKEKGKEREKEEGGKERKERKERDKSKERDKGKERDRSGSRDPTKDRSEKKEKKERKK